MQYQGIGYGDNEQGKGFISRYFNFPQNNYNIFVYISIKFYSIHSR